MTEVCKNGHVFTEENTLWHRDEARGRTRRRCKECKNGFRRQGKPLVTELAAQNTTYHMEDLEDLLRFGATWGEILERGPYSRWDTMSRAVKRRGRLDLLEQLQHRKAQATGRVHAVDSRTTSHDANKKALRQSLMTREDELFEPYSRN